MKLKAAIIGTGNIGTDLLIKSTRSDIIEPVVFVGRRESSDGIQKAKSLGIKTSVEGIDFFLNNPNYCDLVFDCTDAYSAIENYKVFSSQKIKTIDLTPAKIGELCVPLINDDLIITNDNVNMITCGGQSSIPLLHLVSKHCDSLEYIEIVSQISSKSAGMATRINIDEYINTTEKAIVKFTKTKKCKVILNLNPAEPCVDMQTTMFLKYKNIDMTNLLEEFDKKIKSIKSYVPYYELTSLPSLNDDILIISIKIKGNGDYLPSYAGNLDIINCAALKITEKLQ
jgi:acetaldehyde dehydrogenase